MSYLDQGYDPFLDRSVVSETRETSALDTEAILQGVGAEQILSKGSINSVDGLMKYDLDNTIFKVNDGTIDRVLLGKFEDGEIGLRIFDKEGNKLFDMSGETNLIQSSDGRMQLDLTDKQLRVFDETNLRVLIGFQQDGF